MINIQYPILLKQTKSTKTNLLKEMSNFDLDCDTNPITSFELVKDNNGYHQNYTCDSRYNCEITTIPTKISSTNSLNNLYDINIDCGAKAITGVKTIVDDSGNYISYEYTCGDQNLDDLTLHQTPYTSGYSNNFDPLINQKIQCNNNKQLTAYKLAYSFDKFNPTNNKFNYMYVYRCGAPIRTGGITMSGIEVNPAENIQNLFSLNSLNSLEKFHSLSDLESRKSQISRLQVNHTRDGINDINKSNNYFILIFILVVIIIFYILF